jgi:enoyl-CoA hydratase/carnithine racemase
MEYQQLLLEIDDPVATITLNRPDKLNALTLRTLDELRHALTEAESNEAVVGVVLTGAGRGFCSGLDLSVLAEYHQPGGPETGAAPADRNLQEAEVAADFELGFSYLMSLRKPVIAAINGPCAGLGFSLAMFCDLRFVSEAAGLRTVFSRLGLVGEHGMAWLLPRLIGTAKTLDVLWTARTVGAEEALSLGLANRIVEPDRLLDEARGYIRQLARTASPNSLMHMKRQVYSYLMQPLGPAMVDTEALQEQSMRWPDLTEGMTAFGEKRPPDFRRIGGE